MFPKIKGDNVNVKLNPIEIKLDDLKRNDKYEITYKTHEYDITLEYSIYEEIIKTEKTPEKTLTLNSKLVDCLEDNDDNESKDICKNLFKKIELDIPFSRNKSKHFSSKNLFGFESMRNKVLGKTLEINTTEFNQISDSRTTASTGDSRCYTRLECESIVLDDNEVYVSESFADMFFIAGLPYKDSKVISDSDKFKAICEHSDCSILQSYKPDILHRFPIVNYKGFELNSSVGFILIRLLRFAFLKV
jgi:hypothetical protein